MTLAICALCAAVPAAGASTGSVPPPRASTPLDGKGMWIWLMSRSGGTAAAVARQAKRYGIEVVFIKSGDGTNAWSQFSPALVNALHAAGLRVCGWQFVYGSDPQGEARAGAAAADAGADCLVIDAEGHYEGRYAQAQTYMRALRSRVGPAYPLALTSFPYVDYHPTFPYSVFLAPGNAEYNMPQMYWHTIGTTVEENFEHTYRYNRPYGRPIYPLGQTYENPPRREVIAFRRLARSYRAPGVSWWSWQETTGREWNWVGRRLAPQASPAPPARGFAILTEGSRGDLVVWAQQHLVAAGHPVKIDGTYGPRTATIVSEFQEAEGLTPSGVVRASTWRALLEHRPARTSWSRRRAAKLSDAVERAQFSEESPSSGTPELAPTPGVP